MNAYLGINPQLCTGCRSCVLACSFAYFKVFNPEKSYITIERNEEEGTFDIRLTSECVPCKVCVNACVYDALTYIERE